MGVNPATSQRGPHTALPWYLAAGLVGADIGTSVFYSTGVLLPHVGYAAPFFVLAVVVTMWLFKTTYQEGCSVNPVNGGAYAMMLNTVGRRSGLVVGSLTILSYLATAVVSALAGAHYLSSLWGGHWPLWGIFAVAAIPVMAFAVLNLFGLKESTRVVFVIAVFHFAMLIVMDVWGLWIALTQGAHWERLTQGFGQLTAYGVLLGFASAFLGITGFESAAQIVEEIERPITRSVRWIYTTIVALVSFTSPLSSLLIIVLLPEPMIEGYRNNLMSGLALVEGGNPWLVALVLNAMLTLFAAVNTAYAGATGLMTTMGQQGNLPAFVLARWSARIPAFKGYPFVALPFMAASLVMMAVFPGNVDQLGAIYGMAFLGVMISYCAGVVLTRLYHPGKVSRADFLTRWTFRWSNRDIPVPPLLGAGLLLVAEVTLILTDHEARNLGLQLFLGVLLVMGMYRLGIVEGRMVKIPDLRLGMGRLRGRRNLPEELPRLAVCVKEFEPDRVVNVLAYVLKKHAAAGPLEVVIFHAQDAGESVAELEKLSRVISQQLEEFEFFETKDFILTVKVLPGNLDEVLPEYFRANPVTMVYIGTGPDAAASERLREHLSNELELNVNRIDEESLPKGPGIWFQQWLAERASGAGGQLEV
ncbi:MAG: APC family permease [Candidatus Sericytochromatia bacterium]|nr:APC family permease [Candidatus Tanganyikabacteria bacterium]